jgi:hypothetical protein
MAVPKIDEPALWKSDQNDNAKLKRERDSCEKENGPLNNLIARAVTHHVKSKKLGERLSLSALFFPCRRFMPLLAKLTQ